MLAKVCLPSSSLPPRFYSLQSFYRIVSIQLTPTEWANKKVVVFSVPGAFTPGCSAKHLPGFIENISTLKSKGVDVIACLAYNDAFVMSAWGKANNIKGDDIVHPFSLLPPISTSREIKMLIFCNASSFSATPKPHSRRNSAGLWASVRRGMR